VGILTVQSDSSHRHYLIWGPILLS